MVRSRCSNRCWLSILDKRGNFLNPPAEPEARAGHAATHARVLSDESFPCLDPAEHIRFIVGRHPEFHVPWFEFGHFCRARECEDRQKKTNGLEPREQAQPGRQVSASARSANDKFELKSRNPRALSVARAWCPRPSSPRVWHRRPSCPPTWKFFGFSSGCSCCQSPWHRCRASA